MLQEEEQRLEKERLHREEEEQHRFEEEQLRLVEEARRAEEERLLQAIQVTVTSLFVSGIFGSCVLGMFIFDSVLMNMMYVYTMHIPFLNFGVSALIVFYLGPVQECIAGKKCYFGGLVLMTVIH